MACAREVSECCAKSAIKPEKENGTSSGINIGLGIRWIRPWCDSLVVGYQIGEHVLFCLCFAGLRVVRFLRTIINVSHDGRDPLIKFMDLGGAGLT